MKKISTLFLIVLCICVAAVFVSCGEHTHAWDEGNVTTEPTCMYEGTVVYTCECGKTRVSTIDKLNHEYDTDVSYDNAYHYYECTTDKCTAVKDQEEHVWGSGKVTTAATCSKNGIKTYTCFCGATKTETIAKTGHSFDKGTVTKKPSCQSTGVKTYKCSCGESYTEELPIVAHEYEKNWTTTETHHYHACKTAGCEEIKDNAEHVWDEGEVAVEPTCMTVGEKVYTCTCGEERSEEIEALPHVPSEEILYNDRYHYHYCMNEGCTAVADSEAHDFGEGVVTVEPTAEKDGVRTFTCSCGKVKEEAEPYVYHLFDKWTSDETKHYKECIIDGHVDVSEEAEHDWDDGEVISAPTPDSHGVTLYTCKTCGYERTAFKIYKAPAEMGAVNSTEWNDAFKEGTFDNLTIYGNLYIDKDTYVQYIAQYSKDKAYVAYGNANVVVEKYYSVEDGVAYVYTRDSETEAWTKAESEYLYTEAIFLSFFDARGLFFDFVYDTSIEAYVAKDVTLGETSYKTVAFAFDQGTLGYIEAIFEENFAVEGVGSFYAVRFAIYGHDSVEIELPEISEPGES